MKQSSIDWLIDQLEKWELYSKISFQCLKEIEQAKAMHKEEIVDSIVQYMMKHHDVFTEQAILNTVRKSENYYNETFNTKER